MNILTSIQNTLQFINDNWSAIIIVIGLIIAVTKKIKDFFKKSDNEKVELAKKQIKEYILKLVTDAEEDYYYMASAGSIKRSQVIQKIFQDYPILSKVTDQETLIKWIDEMIDESLATMREIFEKNKNQDTEQNINAEGKQ